MLFNCAKLSSLHPTPITLKSWGAHDPIIHMNSLHNAQKQARTQSTKPQLTPSHPGRHTHPDNSEDSAKTRSTCYQSWRNSNRSGDYYRSKPATPNREHINQRIHPYSGVSEFNTKTSPTTNKCNIHHHRGRLLHSIHWRQLIPQQLHQLHSGNWRMVRHS